jgi:two-component system, LytTR family, sensor kinase
VIGLFFAGRNIISTLSRGLSVAWDQGVLFEITYWLIWGLYTPLIFRFARRFHLQNQPRTPSVLALLGFGLLLAPLQVCTEACVNLLIAWQVFQHPTAEILRRITLMPRIILIESFSGLATYAVIVGGYYAFDYYQKFRERELQAVQLEGRLAQSELQNLKMQLHPHFLFNTLHAISVLMQENVTAANRMLVRLSELLRLTLDNAGTQETTLKQELEFLQRYLEIEQTRFSDRLTVQTEIDPATLDARVPNLLLQPLVENAFRHGIARRAGKGLVEIRARREGESLRLEVRDNGPGLHTDRQERLAQGVGLSNTRARLAQLYGEASNFTIGNAVGGGVLVTVVIPFRLEDNPEWQN